MPQINWLSVYLCVAEILSSFSPRCVCLDDKERWSPQQLLKHSFINPQPKMPFLEQSPEGESFTIIFDTLLNINYL